MALFGIITIFTPNRRFPVTTSLHDALLPYFTKWVRLVKQRLSTDFEDFRRLFLTTKNTKKNANGREFLTQKTRETLYSYFLRHRLTPIFTDSKRAKDASTPLNHKPRTVAYESIGNLKNSFWRTSETFRFWTASGKSHLSFG